MKMFGGTHMIDLSNISAFFSQPEVATFAAGYLATKGLDGIFSYTKNKFTDQSLEFQLISALDDSLRETCEHFSWEYDHVAITETFVLSQESLSQINSLEQLREIFIYAIEPEDGNIEDKVLMFWVINFHKQISKPDRKWIHNFIVVHNLHIAVHKLNTILEQHNPAIYMEKLQEYSPAT